LRPFLLLRVNLLNSWRRLKSLHKTSGFMAAAVVLFVVSYQALSFLLFWRGCTIRAHGRTVLARLGLSWDNPLMTTTVDQKHRAVTPFKPGDVLEIEQQGPDVLVLKRTKQAAGTRPRLVRRNRRLVFVGDATTTDEVNRLLEDFP
jgi:hypothetical protein